MGKLRAFVEERPVQIAAAVLLVVALAHWPYGFYRFLRVAICLAAGLLAWNAYEAKKPIWALVMTGIAILFNPIVPIWLKRDEWAIIDLAVAAVFLFCPPKVPAKSPPQD